MLLKKVLLPLVIFSCCATLFTRIMYDTSAKNYSQAVEYVRNYMKDFVAKHSETTYKIAGTRFMETPEGDPMMIELIILDTTDQGTAPFNIQSTHSQFHRWNELKLGDTISIVATPGIECLDKQRPASRTSYIYPVKKDTR